MIETYGVDKKLVERLIKFYRLEDKLRGKIFEVKKSYVSETIPLFCVDGKACILYLDGKKIVSFLPVAEYKGKNGELAGFIVKVEEEGDLFHELEHVKRYLKAVYEDDFVEELVVTFSGFFKALVYKLYTHLNKPEQHKDA